MRSRYRIPRKNGRIRAKPGFTLVSANLIRWLMRSGCHGLPQRARSLFGMYPLHFAPLSKYRIWRCGMGFANRYYALCLPCPDWQIHMLGAPHPPAAPPRNYRAKWERGNRARFLSVHPPHNNYSRKYHSDMGSGVGGGGRMSSRSRGSLLPSHKCKTEKILIHLARLEIDISRRN